MVDNIAKVILPIISEISGVDIEEIKPETNLVNDLEIDSIKAIEIVVAIEKKYKVSIRDEEIPKITSVGQIISLTEDLLMQHK